MRRALDAGASTGGFTDVLLRRGAAHVVAVDVGYGQLVWSLQNDPRVTVMDRTNVRTLDPQTIDPPLDLVVGDLSDISLTHVLPALSGVITDDAEAINTMLSTDGDSPQVCDALEDTGVEYVLDFSADGDFQENDGDYSGFDDLDDSPYVELVEQRGEAKLFRIVSCGLGS